MNIIELFYKYDINTTEDIGCCSPVFEEEHSNYQVLGIVYSYVKVMNFKTK